MPYAYVSDDVANGMAAVSCAVPHAVFVRIRALLLVMLRPAGLNGNAPLFSIVGSLLFGCLVLHLASNGPVSRTEW